MTGRLQGRGANSVYVWWGVSIKDLINWLQLCGASLGLWLQGFWESLNQVGSDKLYTFLLHLSIRTDGMGRSDAPAVQQDTAAWSPQSHAVWRHTTTATMIHSKPFERLQLQLPLSCFTAGGGRPTSKVNRLQRFKVNCQRRTINGSTRCRDTLPPTAWHRLF